MPSCQTPKNLMWQHAEMLTIPPRAHLLIQRSEVAWGQGNLPSKHPETFATLAIIYPLPQLIIKTPYKPLGMLAKNAVTLMLNLSGKPSLAEQCQYRGYICKGNPPLHGYILSRPDVSTSSTLGDQSKYNSYSRT